MNTDRQALWGSLAGALEFETAAVRRLVRLAHRQNRYMRRGDLRRVHLVLQDIEPAVTAAAQLTEQRRRILDRLGFAGMKGAIALKSAALSADEAWRERVVGAVEALARTTERLGRENLQNYQLARFSLDLVGEEMRLLLGATDGSGAAYDAGGSGPVPAVTGAVDGRA